MTRIAIAGAAGRMGEVEALTGPGDTHIKEAAFLLEVAFGVGSVQKW